MVAISCVEVCYTLSRKLKMLSLIFTNGNMSCSADMGVSLSCAMLGMSTPRTCVQEYRQLEERDMRTGRA